MNILSKNGNELVLLGMENEIIHKGDYLLVDDKKLDRKMIIQVFDEDYLSSQSLVEDIVKDEIILATSEENVHDPLNISSISKLVRDAKLVRTKIRSSIDVSGKISSSVSWIPSRVYSSVTKLSIEEMGLLLNRNGSKSIDIGRSEHGQKFQIYAEDLDGKLNIITGKKESGKSHLSKLLIKSLVEYGAFVLVFDLNNEYGGLALTRKDEPSSLGDRVLVLESGGLLRFTLDYCGKFTITNILKNILETPATSLREFFRIWDKLERANTLNMESLGQMINRISMNELVREALVSRYHLLDNSGLFSETIGHGLQFEKIIADMPHGAAIIISLNRASGIIRRIIVELVLSKLVDLLEKHLIPAIFLFAEEAHLYVSETYWDDIITRMRHFGIFTTFITNQPDALGESIYRQVDNLFLFNFLNESDLEKISRVSLVDNDTIKSIVRTLPPRHCLMVGKVVRDLPIVANVPSIDVKTLGATKIFFRPGQGAKGDPS
jgi:DNA helicase HerA-like ATPase